MSYQTDFETWKPAIESLSQDKTKLPNQPVDDFAGSAETLAHEAAKDKEVLQQAGLDVTLIDELTSLSGALRYCQAQWMSEYRARQEAQKEWLAQSPEAYTLRNEMLHHFRFAYRNHPDIKKKVTRISEGAGHTDMIQDLLELAVLGDKHPEPLTAIGYDVAINTQARTTSQSMANLLAEANGARNLTSETKQMRDKAYTLLTDKVSTVREYGRYVFWKNAERREKYLNS